MIAEAAFAAPAGAKVGFDYLQAKYTSALTADTVLRAVSELLQNPSLFLILQEREVLRTFLCRNRVQRQRFKYDNMQHWLTGFLLTF